MFTEEEKIRAIELYFKYGKKHEGLRLSEKVVRRLMVEEQLVVAATAHIAEKSDRLRITLLPEILRRSNLIRNG